MTYTLHAEDPKTTEELVAFYAETLGSGSFVRVVAGPFTRESANAYEELALRLPNVSVLCDFDGANAAAFVAPRKYDGCSYLAEMRSAAGLLEQFERIGEKFAPPVVCSVPAAGAAIPCTLESILALPTAAAGSTEATRYILVNGDGGEGMGTQSWSFLPGCRTNSSPKRARKRCFRLLDLGPSSCSLLFRGRAISRAAHSWGNSRGQLLREAVANS